MNTRHSEGPTGYDEAVFRTLALLVRRLHADRVIEAPDLIRDMHSLAELLDASTASERDCIAGMEGIAATFERELPKWAEVRAVADLYRGQYDH